MAPRARRTYTPLRRALTLNPQAVARNPAAADLQENVRAEIGKTLGADPMSMGEELDPETETKLEMEKTKHQAEFVAQLEAEAEAAMQHARMDIQGFEEQKAELQSELASLQEKAKAIKADNYRLQQQVTHEGELLQETERRVLDSVRASGA